MARCFEGISPFFLYLLFLRLRLSHKQVCNLGLLVSRCRFRPIGSLAGTMSNSSGEFGSSTPLDSYAHATFGQRAEPSTSSELAGRAPLSLRLLRGPLDLDENEAILSQYNHLTASSIPMRAFLRWIQASPEGPAWHALLETDTGAIVGHTSLIPFRATYKGKGFVAAKSEYSFIREEFRAAKIRGFEETGRLKNLIYVDELFRHCRGQGWSPLIISTPERFHRVFRSIRCYPVRFPLWECLLVLRPYQASRSTPNLENWQRAALWSAGLLQSAWWAPSLWGSRDDRRLQQLRVDEQSWNGPNGALSFFLDRDSLAWRYPAAEYERILADPINRGEVILKCGAADRYLRICQSSLSAPPERTLVAELVRKASTQGALGVRWTVYGDGDASSCLIGSLRKLGFLCVRRWRTLLVNSTDEEFLSAGTWNLTDSMFSFDF